MEEYSKTYYSQINTIEQPQALALAEILIKRYNPRSLIDLGCGTGLYMAPFVDDKRLVWGLEISPAALDPEVIQVARPMIELDDLTKPRNVYLKYDLAICLEVVEHVGSESADVLVGNITQYSDTIIMTAAPPGQAGLNHVNCQPMQYWEEKFAKHGFKRDYFDEYQIVNFVVNAPHTVWIIRNLMVFKK